MFRIALANIRFPATPDESVTLAEQAIAQASIERAGIICFPECFIPGYRGMGKSVPPPDPRHGAHIMFHAHFHEAEAGSYQPSTFADPANTFHEKAVLCRAAENTCYIATVNCASAGSPTTSAVVRPDGTLLSYQPYGKEGLLIADIDLTAATGLLASRCKSI